MDLKELKKIKRMYRDRGMLGQNINIAVIDSGIDKFHKEFLHAKIYEDSNKECTSNTFHGTSMVSIINGRTSKVLAIAPKSTIYLFDIFNKCNNDKSYKLLDQKLGEIIYLIDSKKVRFDIINLSIGTALYDKGIQQKIEYLYRKNVIMVAPNGNNIKENIKIYPASYKGVIQVGSLNEKGEVSNFSRKDYNIDVYMLGENIPIAIPQNDYALSNGTSLSTAIITGLIALIIQELKIKNIKIEYSSIIGKLKKLIDI